MGKNSNLMSANLQFRTVRINGLKFHNFLIESVF
jgi:hypothetical protein